MADFRRRTKIERAIVSVTGVCPSLQEVIPAQSGFAPSLTQLIATNLTGGTTAITFYDGDDELIPQITLGASGTLIMDKPGGEQLELTQSSGLFACLGSTGTVRVAAYYVSHDERTPISKEAARTATYIASQAALPKVIRTPTDNSGQQAKT